ncbi:MAG: hypothetical protein IID40_11085 [Planctomycetes bacterium]|nr:hypothetical protein [Planctomycetota bacterium]
MTDEERRQLNERMEGHCRDAIQAQDACNLSAVVHSMGEAMSDLWAMARALDKGTAWVNNQPICRLYASKIAHLTGMFASANMLTFHAEAEELCMLYRTGSADQEIGRLALE